MSLTKTSLSAAITSSDLVWPITSTSSGFPAVGLIQTPGQLIQVDGEYAYIVQTIQSGLIRVRARGSEGTTAQAHDTLAPVSTSSTAADFPAIPVGATVPRPPYSDGLLSVGQNGAIPIPTKDTTFLLTKATALASTTLAAPSQGADGLTLTFTSQTAAAHVITATTLFADAVSGSPHTTATFAAYIGASLTVRADNGLWNVISSTGVTIT